VDTHGVQVLIVDDEPEIGAFLTDLLTSQGFCCTWVDNGPAALAEISPQSPAIVLLDIMMPGMSGLEVLRQIRESKDADPAVIMISCLEHPNTTQRALDQGADHFVVKPLRVKELLDTLQHVLSRRDDRRRSSDFENRVGR
jgi:two-component system OmpR family response regulator